MNSVAHTPRPPAVASRSGDRPAVTPVGHAISPARRLRRATVLSAGVVALGLVAVSCQKAEVQCLTPVSSSIVVEKLTYSPLMKMDILLDIDNSRSMADKQQILALAVPDLVKGLVNPGCIDPNTGEVVAVPVGPMVKCPPGTKRPFEPLTDIHIGIISSSLGGHGSDACSSSGAGKQSNDDRGHLLARVDPAVPAEVETYQNLKFLAWDPAQSLTPPGEADIDLDTAADPDSTALVPQLADMVIGVGQIGCGYEAQLEAWYRFLVDPSPPQNVTLDADGKVLLEGTDTVLLDQRKAFLRPDSLLAIILLSDENDCSIRESGQYYYAAQQKAGNGSPFHLPKGRDICDMDPNDECCFSCGQTGPKDDSGNPICPEDPSCKTADGKTAYLDDIEDNINVRCWNQKRRFGIDFLYGVDRYVEALRSHTVTNRNGEVVPNPIFSDLDPSDLNNNTRSSSLVFLTGIVGVPWQDIARTNSDGAPDLRAGLDPYGRPTGGFKTADEMIFPLPGKDYDTWDVILGDPDNYPASEALPRDPLMIESVEPRTGANPITGDPMVTSAQPLGNTINGHEGSIPKRDDLQFACIFPLPTPRDCAAGGTLSCDCEDIHNDSPLCAKDPATGNPTTQVYGKAYPGIRELHVLKEVGSQGIVASVCPVQIDQPAEADFGYRAAISAILDRLVPTEGDGGCLQRQLEPDEEGRVECVILEARQATVANAAACNCDIPGRIPVSSQYEGAVSALTEDDSSSPFNCVCEIPQLAGSEPGQPLWACQNDASEVPVLEDGSSVDGYCYVDAQLDLGNPDLVAKCPDTERRILRFVGDGGARPGSTLFIACRDEPSPPAGSECGPGPY